MPKKHSVEEDVDGFCGWPFLIKLVNKADSPLMQGLIPGMHQTGGRISEVLSLRKLQVDQTLHPDVVVIKQMLLVKRFEKVGTVTKWKCVGHCAQRWKQAPEPQEFKVHKIKKYSGWLTKTVLDHRTFPIRLDEPLTPYFLSWCEKVRGKNDLLFPIKRSAAFVRVRNIGKELNMSIPLANIHSSEIYDHFFRAERASQLAFDYGFHRDDLDEFFGWKKRKPDMAEKYASLGWIGLARKMGVKV